MWHVSRPRHEDRQEGCTARRASCALRHLFWSMERQFTSQIGGISQSLSKDLSHSLPFLQVFKVHWGISWLKSKTCISPSSASCCYHQTLSTVPVVGGVNEPWTAIKNHQQFVPRFSGKGTRQEIVCFGLARGGLLHSSETLALLCKFPMAFGGLWGVVWTLVAHSSFPHTV